MGLFGVLFDGVLLTTGIAGLRRVAGISVADMVVPRLKNDTARRAVNAYFNLGETLVTRLAVALNNTQPRKRVRYGDNDDYDHDHDGDRHKSTKRRD